MGQQGNLSGKVIAPREVPTVFDGLMTRVHQSLGHKANLGPTWQQCKDNLCLEGQKVEGFFEGYRENIEQLPTLPIIEGRVEQET